MIRFNHRLNTWQARPLGGTRWESITPDLAREFWALGLEVRPELTIV